MDFDVLAHNLPPNTSGVDAHTNLNRMRDLMEKQSTDWGVNYAPGAPSPLAKKLASTEGLISFHMQFFGGVVEVIARNYEVEVVDEA